MHICMYIILYNILSIYSSAHTKRINVMELPLNRYVLYIYIYILVYVYIYLYISMHVYV